MVFNPMYGGSVSADFKFPSCVWNRFSGTSPRGHLTSLEASEIDLSGDSTAARHQHFPLVPPCALSTFSIQSCGIKLYVLCFKAV